MGIRSRSRTLTLLAGLVAGCACGAVAQEPDPAHRLCKVIDSTKLGTEPCRVQADKATIWARMRMEPAEARSFCEQLSKVIRDSPVHFGGSEDWRLSIQSPTSGEDSIAVCALPR